MLAKFNNQVLSQGPTAVLPQHLSDAWLKRLQQVAEDFLDQNFSLEECNDPKDVADPLLSVCVYEILNHHQADTGKIPLEKILEMMTIYAISIIMEAVQRETDIGLEPPNLDNIFSVDRIVAYKKINPAFIKMLKQACIIRESEKGWFDHLKEKILATVLGD